MENKGVDKKKTKSVGSSYSQNTDFTIFRK